MLLVAQADMRELVAFALFAACHALASALENNSAKCASKDALLGRVQHGCWCGFRGHTPDAG
ncbi:hypothetical protein GCM10007972_13020 [Iodidimonas muriae]|uniref:Uncharacterized protein n=1 Tax=Iodidimonas muriae TaxID=261467 RepID=A0ABQ2LEE5_9PROT|nr:hypothetical protein JCM17843_10030 [Kordiimonadales bacterium JCM 17843]GGO10353.1 hypothetical protein GCM10007972_13020 [Iodidimonas muriae]